MQTWMWVHFADSSSFCQAIHIKAVPGSCFHCCCSLPSQLTLCQSHQRTETRNSRAQWNELLELLQAEQQTDGQQNHENGGGGEPDKWLIAQVSLALGVSHPEASALQAQEGLPCSTQIHRCTQRSPAKCFHQECKLTTATRWAKDFSLYQTAVPRIH